jgi:hypothetical protein
MNYKNLRFVDLLRALCIPILFSFLANTGRAQIINDSKYVGQSPPGTIPEIFAPGKISLDNRLETYPTFSQDGMEMFFTVVNASWSQGKIFHTKEKNGTWTQPVVASFSNNNYINWESFISPDGNRQFFASNRPPSSNMDIWMIEKKTDSTWSDPMHVSNPINSSAEDGSACVTNNGTLYFKSSRGGGTGGSWLYRSKPINGTYSQIESLGNIIRTGAGETEPFIAPDESYLIFISQTRSGGHGGWDLWICFQNPDSSWTKPMNMGTEINTAYDEYGPRVTGDGKYLFFTRENRGRTMDIYWVSSSIISNLKTSVPIAIYQSFEQNMRICPNPSNGIFNITFGTFSYENATIRITDIDGRFVLLNSYRNLPAIQVDLTNHPKGIYIVSLTVDGKNLNKKIFLD